MTVLITLSAGLSTGPFDIYDDVDGYDIAIEVGVSRASLIAGFTTSNVRAGATTILVTDTSVCATQTYLPIGVLIPPCADGMDIVFLVDYTGSMGTAINGVKATIVSIVDTIVTESNNNYRLGLVLFDEYTSETVSNYSTKVDYTNLPIAQRVINTGIGSKYQWITAVEMMQTNNQSSFTDQLNILNTSLFPIGNGQGIPEPSDMGVDLVSNDEFAGAFRAGVSRIIILITDAVPSGNDDTYNSTDITFINNLIPQVVSKGIRVLLMTTAAASALDTLAIGTGGIVSNGFSGAEIITALEEICDTIVPTTTTTTTIPSALCRFVEVADSVDQSRYGVRYLREDGNVIDIVFSSMLGAPTVNGTLFAYCSVTPGETWDSLVNALVVIPGIDYLPSGGLCDDGDPCITLTPTTTTTTTIVPTTTVAPTTTIAPTTTTTTLIPTTTTTLALNCSLDGTATAFFETTTTVAPTTTTTTTSETLTCAIIISEDTDAAIDLCPVAGRKIAQIFTIPQTLNIGNIGVTWTTLGSPDFDFSLSLYNVSGGEPTTLIVTSPTLYPASLADQLMHLFTFDYTLAAGTYAFVIERVNIVLCDDLNHADPQVNMSHNYTEGHVAFYEPNTWMQFDWDLTSIINYYTPCIETAVPTTTTVAPTTTTVAPTTTTVAPTTTTVAPTTTTVAPILVTVREEPYPAGNIYDKQATFEITSGDATIEVRYELIAENGSGAQYISLAVPNNFGTLYDIGEFRQHTYSIYDFNSFSAPLRLFGAASGEFCTVRVTILSTSNGVIQTPNYVDITMTMP